MTGAELIKVILEADLEDFEFEFSFVDGFGYSGFPNRRSFEIIQVDDIGYSSKTVILGGEEKE